MIGSQPMINKLRQLKLLLLNPSFGLFFEQFSTIKRNLFKFTAEQQRVSIHLSKLLALSKLFFSALAFYPLNTMTVSV
jgi:hypothetical protein